MFSLQVGQQLDNIQFCETMIHFCHRESHILSFIALEYNYLSQLAHQLDQPELVKTNQRSWSTCLSLTRPLI